MTQIIDFIISWQLLSGIIIGICIILFYSLIRKYVQFPFSSVYKFLKVRGKDQRKREEDKTAAYQSIKLHLNEMLDTLFSPANVKNSVSAKVKNSVNNRLLADNNDQLIKNEILEANYKYMAFGETITRTTYTNKQLINDYHNFIYKIIEKIDTKNLSSGT